MPSTSGVPSDQERISTEIFGMVPAWLMSLVTHLTLLLLLALFQVIGSGDWHDSIVLDCSTTDDVGDDAAMLSASIEVPSQLSPTQPEQAESTELVSLDPELLSTSDIALVEPSGQMGELVGQALDGDLGAAHTAAAKTAVFGLAAEGETFVYVFDRSESMNSTLTYQSEGTTVFSVTPLAAAKAELLRSLGDLDRGQHFHILFYNHEVWMFDPGRSASHQLVPATARYKRRAEDFIRSVYGHGNTRHVKPLEIALRMRPDVIFLLTDGEAKDDPSSLDLARLKKLNDGRAKINVIQFCYATRTDSSLVRLANENGGRHIFMNITQLGPGMAAMAP